MNLDPNLIQRVLSNADVLGIDRADTLRKLEEFNGLVSELNIDPATLGWPVDYSRAPRCLDCNKAFIPSGMRDQIYCSPDCSRRRYQRLWRRKTRAATAHR